MTAAIANFIVFAYCHRMRYLKGLKVSTVKQFYISRHVYTVWILIDSGLLLLWILIWYNTQGNTVILFLNHYLIVKVSTKYLSSWFNSVEISSSTVNYFVSVKFVFTDDAYMFWGNFFLLNVTLNILADIQKKMLALFYGTTFWWSNFMPCQ